MGRADALLVALMASLLSCRRDRRDLSGQTMGVATSDLPTAAAGEPNPFESNAFGIAQGQLLYQWFNCTGCHAQGGGAMGPPLIDAKWRYGGGPADIFNTIAHGRPNGMPAFGQRMPREQIWQLVAYVQSLSGHVPQDVAPGRADSMQGTEPPSMTKRAPIVGEPATPAAAKDGGS
jgi:cytochrome c oxidase cbb3-type subunit 3